MLKKQWIFAAAATGLLFVASLVCLISSALLYRRLFSPFPVFNRVIVRGAAEQVLQNYTAPAALLGAVEARTFSLKTLYANSSKTTEASLPGLDPESQTYRFPSLAQINIQNATSAGQAGADAWTAANATVLGLFDVPVIEALRVGQMNVTRVQAQNTTTLSLLAVSQNGTTQNVTCSQTGWVKQRAANRVHRNLNETAASTFVSAGQAAFSGWVNTSARLVMEQGFAVQNSSLNASQARLNTPLITAPDAARVDFDTVQARVLQLTQTQPSLLSNLTAANLTTRATGVEALETSAVLANVLRADNLTTEQAAAAGTLSSESLVAAQAVAESWLGVGTHTQISDLETRLGAGLVRVADRDDPETYLDATSSLESSGPLSLQAGATLTFDSSQVQITEANFSTGVSVAGTATVATLEVGQAAQAAQTSAGATTTQDLTTLTLSVLQRLTANQYQVGTTTIKPATIQAGSSSEHLIGLYRGGVEVCDCTAKTKTCYEGGTITNDWCQKLFDPTTANVVGAWWNYGR